MTMSPRSILCVGNDIASLTSRCRVLALEGYFADSATPDDFLKKLSAGKFDLVILSVVLSDDEKRMAHQVIPANVKILDLDRLMFPDELLRLVGQTLT